MRFGPSLRLLGLFLLWFAAASPAQSHPLGMSLAEIELGPDATVLNLRMAAEDLERALGASFYDRGADVVSSERLAALRPALDAYLAERLTLSVGASPCTRSAFAVSTEGHVVRATMRWGCGEDAGELTLDSRLLLEIEPRFIQIVRVQVGNAVSEKILEAGAHEAALLDRPDPLAVIRSYVLAGIEHIFVGYDHIAFLTALLLWATRLLPVVKVVTAFTIAHSITLTLAVLDLVTIPASIVEPLIAVTVIWVAAENFVSHSVESRWRLTFALGLVHGFGFAGVLQEYGLPPRSLGMALVSFNIGVEIGQLMIVMLIMPLLLAADRLWADRPGRPQRAPGLVYGVSLPVGLLGVWWLAERTVL